MGVAWFGCRAARAARSRLSGTNPWNLARHGGTTGGPSPRPRFLSAGDCGVAQYLRVQALPSPRCGRRPSHQHRLWTNPCALFRAGRQRPTRSRKMDFKVENPGGLRLALRQGIRERASRIADRHPVTACERNRPLSQPVPCPVARSSTSGGTERDAPPRRSLIATCGTAQAGLSFATLVCNPQRLLASRRKVAATFARLPEVDWGGVDPCVRSPWRALRGI